MAFSPASTGKSATERSAAGTASRLAGYAPGAPETSPSSRLAGLSRGQVADLLGEPTWIRRESRAEVWQYRSATCTLDLYLYLETGGYRVAHAEARDRNARQVPVDACLGSIRAGLFSTPAS